MNAEPGETQTGGQWSAIQDPEPGIHGHPDIVRVALLVAAAAVLQVAESFIPYPVPGVRIGLANVVTLVALVRLGRGEAIRISFLRTVIGSVFMGTFLSPTFLLSLSGALASALAMAGLHFLGEKTPARFSLLGISLAGAVTHMLAQVLVAYFLLIRAAAIVTLMPWLALAAVATGLLTGVVALQAARKLRAEETEFTAKTPRREARAGVGPVGDPLPAAVGTDRPAVSVLSRAPAWLKVSVTLLLAVALVAGQHRVVFAAVALFLALSAALARVSFARLGRDLRRVGLLAALAFVVPALATGYGRVLFALGPLRVTGDGLAAGGFFAARVLLLSLATTILAWTTAPATIVRVLDAPLRAVGRSGRMAETAGLAWSAFPMLWDYARRFITGRLRRPGRVRALAGLVAEVYREAEEIGAR